MEQGIVATGSYNMDALSEYPEPPSDTQEIPKGPIIDRIKSKNFKERQRAFEDLIKELEWSTSSSGFSEYTEWEAYMWGHFFW